MTTANTSPKIFNPWRYTAVMFCASVILPALNFVSVLLFDTIVSNPVTDFFPTIIASFVEGLRGAKVALISTARKLWAASFYMALISLAFGLLFMALTHLALITSERMQLGLIPADWLQFVAITLAASLILARLFFSLGVRWVTWKSPPGHAR